MTRLSIDAVVAIVGVLVTLPPTIIILWRLLRKNGKCEDQIEVCLTRDLSYAEKPSITDKLRID
jgi:hypothetical protein